VARKRTKKEAKERIRDLPVIPKIRLPIGPSIGDIAERLVDIDPFDRLREDELPGRPKQGPKFRSAPANQGEQIMMALVNDPEFTLTKDDVKMINSPNRMLLSNGNGELMEVNGKDVIRNSSQFGRSSLLFGIGLGLGDRDKEKKGRKKTKTDKNMSTALTQANSELRIKNGKLRKGKTQGDVMRRAHRIRKQLESK